MSFLNAIKDILGFTPTSTGQVNRQATHSQKLTRKVVQAINPLADIEITDEYKKAKSLLDARVALIFVTGKAGTGKTTFIHYLRHSITSNCVVLAPTGVAALNIHGATIHSFFRFPPRILSDTDVKPTRKRQLYEKLNVLIIDEISMVRADVVDAMDAFLRLNGRDKNKPFGGVQVVMVGDLYQLPPVVSTQEEATFFSRRYTSPFFFSAKALEEHVIAPLELTRVFRQQEPTFINMLNYVRLGNVTRSLLQRLNTRVGVVEPQDRPIVLTTTNAQADSINEKHLADLGGDEKDYVGIISGTFNVEGKKLPAPLHLKLKPNARVMFTKNDNERRWVNGSLGLVKSLDTDKISVQLLDGGAGGVDVERVTWETYKYEYDYEEEKIIPIVTGSLTQFPLILAWAITIHKGQGKTLPTAKVDFGDGAFAPGQAYVALSRCRRLEDVWLSRQVTSEDIFCDARIKEFYKAIFTGLGTDEAHVPTMPINSQSVQRLTASEAVEEQASASGFREMVEDAMHTGACLRIDYLDYSGNSSQRIIMPGEWVDGDKFTAFCFLRNDDRHFRVTRMQGCAVFLKGEGE